MKPIMRYSRELRILQINHDYKYFFIYFTFSQFLKLIWITCLLKSNDVNFHTFLFVWFTMMCTTHVMVWLPKDAFGNWELHCEWKQRKSLFLSQIQKESRAFTIFLFFHSLSCPVNMCSNLLHALLYLIAACKYPQ